MKLAKIILEFIIVTVVLLVVIVFSVILIAHPQFKFMLHTR